MNSKSVQERYLTKYFYGSSHWWAKKIIDNFPKNTKVLDVGPGSGFVADILNLDDYKIFAIEIDQKTRELLQDKYNGIYEDLSELKENEFDVVIMLDVLEHMTNPVQFLKNILKLLKPNSELIISVPNVAHWSVRLPLLFGVFDYYDRGILDRTHYQFFTRKRVRSIIKELELILIEENSSIEPLEFVVPESFSKSKLFNNLSIIRQKIAEFLPGFFAYQHLIRVKKK